MHSDVRAYLREIDAAWAECIREIGVEDLRPLSMSGEDPARRTYAADGIVYKITLLSHARDASMRVQGLEGEYKMLLRCQKCSNVPHVLHYRKAHKYEYLAMQEFRGEPVDTTGTGRGLSFGQHVSLLRTIGSLAIRGIAHNDIKPSNVLVGSDGTLCLVDFDQARLASPVKALCAGILGITMANNVVHGSYASIIKGEVRRRLPPRLIRAIKSLLGKMNANEVLPAISNNDEAAQLLRQAWDLAQLSNANSPGGLVAYYSLDHGGYRFPGERPWEERWNYLRCVQNFRNKRVLELGCNMGLLSCYLLKESGASAVLGVDANGAILRSAALVAKAFNVRPEFAQINFDSYTAWEGRLAAFRPDIVFALNVLHWLRDKERFLAFLGRFGTVVLEGHDDSTTEQRRLAKHGFTDTKVISVSERGRPVILASK